MNDRTLRASILIVAEAYATRGDQYGDLISKALKSIVRTADTLDSTAEPPKPSPQETETPHD